MPKLVFILFFFFSVSVYISGQDSDGWNPEKKTFELYKQQNWPELIYWGKKALNEGNDYFYMRMRIGIAYFERKNYHKALVHFKKAAEFNDKDPYLIEYLYFANLYSGRDKAALDESRKFTTSKTKKFLSERFSKLKIGSLGMQLYSGSLTTNEDLIKNIDDPSLDGYQVFTKNSIKLHAGFNHLVSRRFNLYYQYGLFIDNRFTYYQDNLQAYYFNSQKLYEHHLYVLGGIYLGKDFNLYLSAHYIPGKIPEFYSGSRFSYSYIPAYKYNDFTSYIGLTKDFTYLKAGLSSSFSYLNFSKFLQEGFSITIFPLGNLNLYFGSAYYLQQEVGSGRLYRRGASWEYMAGIKLFNPLWLEVKGKTGDLHYTVSEFGWQVFNSPNPSDMLFSGSLLIPFNMDKTIFSINFNYMNSVSSFITDDATQTKLNSTTYFIYSIYGGLSWKF